MGSSNTMRYCLVAILLSIFALQVLLTSRQMSPAYDETATLPAGYVFLRTGQRHVLPEPPPLIAALSALPLLAFNLRLDLDERLKRYLDDHRFDKVNLAYFTTGRPEYYGSRSEWMRPPDLARTPEPATYIIGA